MPITVTKEGTADDSSIIGMNLVLDEHQGLQVEVYYRVGDTSKHMKLIPSENFKSRIAGTYDEIIAAINDAEGLT
jgi:hypothetical protein